MRSLLLFLGGFAGVLHELIVTHGERPYLLLMFGAMMGLPAFLPTGEERKSSRKEKDEGE